MHDVFVTTIEKDDYADQESLIKNCRRPFCISPGVRANGECAGIPFQYGFHRCTSQTISKVAPDAVFVFTSSFAVYPLPKKGQIVDEKFPSVLGVNMEYQNSPSKSSSEIIRNERAWRLSYSEFLMYTDRKTYRPTRLSTECDMQ